MDNFDSEEFQGKLKNAAEACLAHLSKAPSRPTSGSWSDAKHVVTGANLTRPSRHAGMGQRPRYLNGADGWFAVCSQCGSRNVDMVVTGTKR
jgi:hypothetical protein